MEGASLLMFFLTPSLTLCLLDLSLNTTKSNENSPGG